VNPVFITPLTAILVIAAAVLYLRRLRAQRAQASTGLTDDMIRAIEGEGRIDVEEAEPLDLDHIREEESRFWEEEPWDETEEL
jgi:hypothetical protein